MYIRYVYQFRQVTRHGEISNYGDDRFYFSVRRLASSKLYNNNINYNQHPNKLY